MSLRIGVLGPLLATRGGVAVGLSRGRTAVLLAALAMSAGHPVSAARLAELVWPDEQPEWVRASLQTLVARLRGLLPGVIVTLGDGYLLDIDPDQVDLLRFRRLARAAEEASDPAAARRLLDQALELWRGEPLVDLRSAALDRDVIPGLTEEYLSAVQRRADLDLAAGRHDRVIAELRGLTGRYPLREPLWDQLLRALAGAGRPAEAIQEYHRAREILAAELGVDPSLDLQGLYQQLLQADRPSATFEQSPGAPTEQPPAAPAERSHSVPAALSPGAPAAALSRPDPTQWAPLVPRQLPAGVAGFAGRDGPLKALSELADEAVADPRTVVISVVSGMAGVGKTALAVHSAHQEAAKFPDGQLYADLRGFGPGGNPPSPTEVVRGFLSALGVPATRIPASPEALAALYRTILAGRRIMIVLDNARDADQVRPLLPGSPGCMVVVTSRSPLTPLAAGHGARLIPLDVLTDGEAAELLAARLGAERVAADPQTAAELAALCGRLPLALAITAARAAARAQLPLAASAGELRNARQRLDALDGGDPASNLRAVFSWSCQQLSGEAAEMFWLLGVHPGPDISLPAAASLAATEPPEADAALRELTGLNLVTEHRPGRYTLHDLLHAYAAEQATAILPASSRQEAVHRVLDHYLHTSRNAATRLNPLPYPLMLSPPQDKAVTVTFSSSHQAMDWLDAEHQVLLAVTALAASTGFDTHAWQIPATVTRYLDGHGHWQDWAEMQYLALQAAERLGDKNAQASVHRASGGLYVRLALHDQAREHFGRALELYRELDDQVGQALAHGGLSVSLEFQGRYREALAHSERAFDLSRSAGNPQVSATMLNRVGWHAAHLGEYQRALACCQQALDLLREHTSPYTEGCIWDSLGYIHQHLGHHTESIDCYQRAASLFREIGNRFELADTLASLGDACDTAGQPAAARDAWQQAFTILNELHHPDAARVHAKLLHDGFASADKQYVPAPCSSN
ncbi:MAG: tetratricopeptide repeat protein [Streptosporangiaceae bacterium]|nr:tetratricopeptide repeat protein [Streptosporangiaceae bacterium]